MPLLLEQFLAGNTNAKPAATIDAPELGEGGVVYVREMPLWATIRISELSGRAKAADGPGNADAAGAMAEAFAACAVSAEGKPLFGDELLDAAGLAKVMKLPSSLVARVAEAAVKGSALAGGEDTKKPSPQT